MKLVTEKAVIIVPTLNYLSTCSVVPETGTEDLSASFRWRDILKRYPRQQATSTSGQKILHKS